MAEATLSSKNQIVVPKLARQALDIKAGDKLLIVVRGASVFALQKPKSYSEAIRGMGRKGFPSGHLKKERGSWE